MNNLSDICIRTREARERANLDGVNVAATLKIEYGTYKKYESRTPLRQQFIIPFCDLCGISVKWLLSGEGAMLSPDKEERDHPLIMRLSSLDRATLTDIEGLISPIIDRSISNNKK